MQKGWLSLTDRVAPIRRNTQENRDKYLLTNRWFVKKRNETTKQKPFQLIKKIDITIYFPFDSISLKTQSFSVENDIPMDSLNNELRSLLENTSLDEVFFSAEFSFFEKESTENIWDKLITGISTMQLFMEKMYLAVGECCPLCDQLREKIRTSKISTAPKDLWLINDYVYDPSQNTFKRANRFSMRFYREGGIAATKSPLTDLTEANYFNYDGTPFGTFVLMHAMIRTFSPNADIMPAILTIYNDDTYDLDVFHADIKTTLYRKITEVSQKIKEDDIHQICFMSLYSYTSFEYNALKTSIERIPTPSQDILAFMSVDQELNEMEYVFDGDSLSNPEYIANTMKYGRKNKLEVGKFNMSPILKAFEFRRLNKI